jgi:hypothetical protein
VRRVLSWRLSNTLTAGFCVEALSEALARFGKPGIFNTDQGAQFTSDEFTQMLRDHEIQRLARCGSEDAKAEPRQFIPGEIPVASIGPLRSDRLRV